MRCPICKQIISAITPAHALSHGFSPSSEMQKVYPEIRLVGQYAQAKHTLHKIETKDQRKPRIFTKGCGV